MIPYPKALHQKESLVRNKGLEKGKKEKLQGLVEKLP